mmetsp:Transcript_31002/g.68078  ORF Transcript_31002/g.68078 Transcript_31002/m.68078 type:complete len:463 (-) Transcript_31002:173-1561(-)|eukprot:CAMPEP_0204271290 /NCGR_PEP_ID=MMETSP0468-20130131/19408_1 /ASSEMBLY_ACC=CAM_ASM_000383 /TAXON_ID=2969 /ORGANISM="Oxyrrhis marina" /LENGTH=462 /DNA_ID=CAMNT_0051246921 /DNA_START=87 /DNA_END=1475 /DNA_ORIENTATION=+
MAQEPATIINEGLDSLVKDPKAVEDYSKETEEMLAKADSLVKSGRHEEAVEELLVLEKKARMACDAFSVSKLVCQVAQIYFDKQELEKLQEAIMVMTKKRSQLKKVICDVVQKCMGWFDSMPTREKKVKFIEVLQQVTEGKIFVEVEHARMTRTLAQMKEDDGDLDGAADLLQEVQVETFGAMERIEKANYILDQMRLVLARGDMVRCQIMSKKINPKLLETDDFQDIKVTFYKYMIKYWLHMGNMLEVAKCYYQTLHTPKVQADESQWRPALEAYILYLVLAPITNEQTDMLNKVGHMERKIEQLHVHRQLVKDYLRKELIPWPLPVEADLRNHVVFLDSEHKGGEDRWTLLHKRVVQHNIWVLSMYYTRLSTTHMAELLGLTADRTEEELSELVISKFLYARIDRPSKIVHFGQKPTSAERLNSWSSDISGIVTSLEKCCHLIGKEQMVHAARAKLKAKK